MTRQTKFASTGAALLVVYVSLWFHLLPTPFIDDSIRDQIVPCVRLAVLDDEHKPLKADEHLARALL
jgi:hypothetical protein